MIISVPIDSECMLWKVVVFRLSFARSFITIHYLAWIAVHPRKKSCRWCPHSPPCVSNSKALHSSTPTSIPRRTFSPNSPGLASHNTNNPKHTHTHTHTHVPHSKGTTVRKKYRKILSSKITLSQKKATQLFRSNFWINSQRTLSSWATSTSWICSKSAAFTMTSSKWSISPQYSLSSPSLQSPLNKNVLCSLLRRIAGYQYIQNTVDSQI